MPADDCGCFGFDLLSRPLEEACADGGDGVLALRADPDGGAVCD